MSKVWILLIIISGLRVAAIDTRTEFNRLEDCKAAVEVIKKDKYWEERYTGYSPLLICLEKTK